MNIKSIFTHINAAIVGAPFDLGSSYASGTRFAPEAVRSASVVLRPFNTEYSLDPFESLSVVDAGDLPVVPGQTEESIASMREALGEIHRCGVIPVVIGGDQTISIATLQAAAQVHGPVALIAFDSHTDVFPSFYGHEMGHSTAFRVAALSGAVDASASTLLGARGTLFAADEWQEASELGFQVVTTNEILGLSPSGSGLAKKAIERAGSRHVYVCIDIDVLDPAYAPGTGTPEVGGLTTLQLRALLQQLRGAQIVGFEVVEVNPTLDASRLTALTAATMIADGLALIASGRKDLTDG